MLRFSAGELIAQVVANGTPQELAINTTLRLEITLILSPSGDLQVFHDDEGNGVFDGTTLILSGPFQSQGAGSGIFIKPGGQLAVSGNGVVSIYGITENQTQ